MKFPLIQILLEGDIKQKRRNLMLTAEGLIPPSAVYKANLPTGIPIPYNDQET